MSVAWKLLEKLVPGGTDLEAVHGWLLRFGEDRKQIVLVINFPSTGYPMGSRPGQFIMHLYMDA